MSWLIIEGLNKNFGPINALSDINIELDGDKIGIFGPNGSGKSTLIRILLRLIKNYNGFFDLNIKPSNVRIVPERPELPKNYTIGDWITVCRKIHGEEQVDLDVMLNKFALNWEWKIGNLSAGQYRKAAILVIFFGEPKLIILDEPTNFLDIIAREVIINEVEKFIEKLDSRIIIASHRIDEIRKFAEEILIMDNGEILDVVKIKDENRSEYVVEVTAGTEFMELLTSRDVEFKRLNVDNNKFVIKYNNNLFCLFETYMSKGNRIKKFRETDKIDELMEIYTDGL